MSATINAAIEPLIKRKIFGTEGEAIREILREYVLGQITTLRQDIDRFERKYGMRFHLFDEYLHERSVLLESGDLSTEQRQIVSQVIMQEEDDWLGWKATQEMLESWLGIRQEITV